MSGSRLSWAWRSITPSSAAGSGYERGLLQEALNRLHRRRRLLFHQPMARFGNDVRGYVARHETDFRRHGSVEGFFCADGEHGDLQLAELRQHGLVVDRILGKGGELL